MIERIAPDRRTGMTMPPRGSHWLVAIATLLGACGPLDLGKKGWQCKNSAVLFSGGSDASAGALPQAARAWDFDVAQWGTPKIGTQKLEAGVHITTASYSFIGSNNNGGASLHFDGSTYVHGPLNGADTQTPVQSNSITYSLWISPHERWLNAGVQPDAGTGSGTVVKMVLLSTRWEQDATHCGGHELSLARHLGSDRRVVRLSFGYYDSGCAWTTRPVTLDLDGHWTPDAWGQWHHVAASYDHGQVTLYWNNDRKIQHVSATATSPALEAGASPAQLCLGADCVTSPRADGSTALCVGTDCASNVQPQGSELTTIRYIGLMDELAIFDAALKSPEVDALWLTSQTPISVGGTQWAARSGPRSSSSLSVAPGGGVLLDIVDGKSSAGGAIALLDEQARGTSLSEVSIARLSANLPRGEYPLGLNITANQGREFCAWYIDGTGGNEYYLARLPEYMVASGVEQVGSYPSYQADRRLRYTAKWCRCDDCECSSQVEEANIYSPWLEVESQTCILCDLQLAATEHTDTSDASPAADWSSSRGAWGPQGLCWRPISYNQNSFAQFTEPPSPDRVSARLAGEPKSGALLVADFGVRDRLRQETEPAAKEQDLLDLSDCSTVCIEASVGLDDKYKAVPSIIVVSANSATAELDVKTARTSDDGLEKYCIDLTDFRDAKNPDGIVDESDSDVTGNLSVVGFDWHRVRYIGIQKDWKNEQDVVASIQRISVCGKGGGACQLTGRWSSLATSPCTFED